jgi:hypothetical protein
MKPLFICLLYFALQSFAYSQVWYGHLNFLGGEEFEDRSGYSISLNADGNILAGEAANDHSGASVSLNSDGSIVAIGAALNSGNGNNSGHVSGLSI